MKKLFIIPAMLALSACGNDSDSKPSPEGEQEQRVEKPVPMKIDPGLKESFVKECESADPKSDLGIVYRLINIAESIPDCGGKFDHLAKTRRATFGVGFASSLEPLKHIPFVEEVVVTGPVGKTSAPLAPLKNLQNLVITSASIEDISSLKDAKYLNSLVIGNSPIKDVSPLVSLKNLENFSLSEIRDEKKNPTLPKDEKHCPVKSDNRAVTIACKEYRGIK